MDIFYRLFLTLIALSLAVVVFMTKVDIALLNALDEKWADIPHYLSFSGYVVACILLAWFSLFMARFLSSDHMSQDSVERLEQANDIFLPSYLGYFFVALSTPNWEVFLFVFSIILILIFFSRAGYFNPLYFLFGYRFYYITTTRSVTVLLITKRRLKVPSDIHFDKIKRVNDFTFIDVGGDK